MEFSAAAIETEIAFIIKFMQNDFKMEGMYVIENILLRPPFDYRRRQYPSPVYAGLP